MLGVAQPTLVEIWEKRKPINKNPESCEPFFPLQHSKTPRTPNLSKISPDDCFLGFQSGGPKFVKICRKIDCSVFSKNSGLKPPFVSSCLDFPKTEQNWNIANCNTASDNLVVFFFVLGNFGAGGKQEHGREPCADFFWILPAFNLNSGESSRPLIPILLKSFAIHLPFLSRYFGKSMPSSRQKVVYTSPICIAIRLPFVSRYFCRSIRVRGRWNTPKFSLAVLPFEVF